MELYAYGINYWKIPLASNEDFLSEMERLIKAEIISERLMGNPLKRDLFNFVYRVVTIIKKASPFLEANMLKKDENTVSGSIPKLVVFKAVQHMYGYKNRKLEFEKSEELRALRIQSITRMKEEHRLATSLLAKKEQEAKLKVDTSVVDNTLNTSATGLNNTENSPTTKERKNSP